MALKSPLTPASAFSPYTDSPNSPAHFSNQFSATSNPQSNRSSVQADSLAPPASPYPQQIEPSPVDSNGTEIEEGEQEDTPKPAANGEAPGFTSPDIHITSPDTNNPPKINTQLSARRRADSAEDGPQSVIHVPLGFKDFDGVEQSQMSPFGHFSNHVVSPATPEAIVDPVQEKRPSSISPVNTNIPRYMDRSTPRAQTRQEVDDESKRRSTRSSSLEDIPESLERDGNENSDGVDDHFHTNSGTNYDQTAISRSVQTILSQADEEVTALRTALGECWTLCNTLAGLSSSHRQRTFKFTGRTEVQEQAWLSCWRLCQQLYEHKDADHSSQVGPTLELCRDFCQSLFDARQKVDEASDSVLRVSFELSNHLYTTHGRVHPDAFNERTLDFYITLCHRLMKQRTSLPQETDSLLRACWSLAEMLFNLRQGTQEGKPADEELLGSAVQACWELCDLFREGWTQIRPDRNTPRPSQMTFNSQVAISFRSNSSASNGRSTSSMSNRQYHEAPPFPPETPITVFDDTSTANSSPDGPNVPNILVLGPSIPSNAKANSVRGGGTHHERWSSNASAMSDEYSESAKSTSSQRSASTATGSGEEAQLLRLRCLLLKAGVNTGFNRTSGQQLPAYVKTLSDNAFGSLPWQMKVLSFYRKLVTNDKSMQTVHALPGRRLSASEAAKAVRWLGNSEQWAWMRDLFRIIYGFGVEEADRRGGSFQV